MDIGLLIDAAEIIGLVGLALHYFKLFPFGEVEVGSIPKDFQRDLRPGRAAIRARLDNKQARRNS